MDKLTKILIKFRLTNLVSNQDMLKVIKKSIKSANLESDTLKVIKESRSTKEFDQFLLLFKSLDTKNIRAINYLSDEYPESLREIYNPPALLFYQGRIELLKTKKIAIVGSRSASNYGISCVDGLVPNLIDRYTIVSGLANGIDGRSQRCAVANGGNTIAVIGTGLNRFYPRNNQGLQRQIANYGLVLSEYPPDSFANPWHFPQRNRIIAGISQKLIVVEAKIRSGALITAGLALENNREIYAVPGRVDSELSDGCNQLIFDGAIPLLNVDILK
ncbi:DNA-processing protein DprA [Companilactobacillus keshanensis]|uniref:DNA-processing protein DprA n=1 Tax=Companilactobacillus keshanensis TaxID=2486003 RepID=A0ABW4BV53_9LACO|nr:DNA-processing protein DprA [Companilactobacillus keshanensis]